MIKLQTFSSKGIKGKPVSLPKNFEEKKNLKLLAQAVRVYENRNHPGLSKVKSRSEVSAATRKIYRQKGTGRARHGAISAPIFVGGGQVHGPDGRKKVLTMPKKMARKAMAVALSEKARKNRVFVVSNVSTFKKTKEAATLINKITKSLKVEKKNPRITIALADENKKAELAFRNIENIKIELFRNLNAYKVYLGGILLVDKDALSKKNSKSKKAEKKRGASRAGSSSRASKKGGRSRTSV